MDFKHFLETKTATGAILKVIVPVINYSRTAVAESFL